jgi:proteasome accessory factor C
MSDEAFARRFYSDRAELTALGVPLTSNRDEFTGEELYTLRSEQYFLPAIELSDEELAALQTCLYLLEGQFAYSEPLRLALQNLALGRPGLPPTPSANAVRVNVLGTDYTHEMPGRLSKLEAAISSATTSTASPSGCSGSRAFAGTSASRPDESATSEPRSTTTRRRCAADRPGRSERSAARHGSR